MSDGESITAAQCRNCDVVFGEPRPTYCPSCGQETAAHPPTVWEFGHEFITHYIALEGKLWNTLGLLFFRPGALTQRYLIGQKRRYVNPLRLYLTASILFFIVVKLFGADLLMNAQFNEEARLQAANEMVTEVRSEAAKDSVNKRPVIVTSKALPNLALELPGSENKNSVTRAARTLRPDDGGISKHAVDDWHLKVSSQGRYQVTCRSFPFLRL